MSKPNMIKLPIAVRGFGGVTQQSGIPVALEAAYAQYYQAILEYGDETHLAELRKLHKSLLRSVREKK